MGQNVGLIALAALGGGVSAAHVIKFYSVAHCLPPPPTPWPAPIPFTPTYPQSATRTYPPKKK